MEVSNLYSAFLALAATALSPNGQVAAITPRSFANGPYFRDFRRFFLDLMRLDVLHVFESRTAVFADSGVLQENLVFLATRSDAESRPPVVISTSTGYHDTPQKRIVPYTEVVRPHDPERFIHITVHEQDAELTHILDALPNTLTDLDIQVSTGRVVDFRVKEHLRAEPGDGDIPLIYPLHMEDGRVRWPVPDAKKPNGLAFNQATAKLALPSGHYVIVKRMSSKEERRRVVAALFDPSDVICNAVGFENHVNVFHCNNTGLPADLASGLCLWLNSTIVDRLIRQFNGHTQINATDLRMLRYPTVTELRELGAAWGAGDWPDQEKIDNLVSQHVSACKDTA